MFLRACGTGSPKDQLTVFSFDMFVNKLTRILNSKNIGPVVYIKNARNASYIQGQSPKPGIREYFYYIDHQGQLFLDDSKMKNFTSCFKEKKFLAFFFNRLKENDSGRYEEFPYMSPCGRERNYVRCDDKPIVFTQVLEKASGDSTQVQYYLSYAHAGDLLTVKFEPQHVCMLPESGRIYHPAEDCEGIGLIKSSLAIEFSHYFEYEKGADDDAFPTHFTWRGVRYKLSQKLLSKVNR